MTHVFAASLLHSAPRAALSTGSQPRDIPAFARLWSFGNIAYITAFHAMLLRLAGPPNHPPNLRGDALSLTLSIASLRQPVPSVMRFQCGNLQYYPTRRQKVQIALASLNIAHRPTHRPTRPASHAVTPIHMHQPNHCRHKHLPPFLSSCCHFCHCHVFVARCHGNLCTT
jgi:hypothetical protein